ncbi:MAG: hypothetical protein FJZ16_09005, partial [Candidatus Omnitrophica bacterium]|nr:hypothetical protein [Candidatus Omnitrophota bacterium]
MAGTVGLSVACAKHEPVPPPIITPTPPITAPAPTPAPSPVPIPVDNPPQILSYDMPQEVNAGQEFLGTATATDDYGIERVYVVFRNSEKLETTMEKADGEYKASLKLPSKGEYWYSIKAMDTKGQEAKPVEGRMIVYPALDSDEDGDGFTWEQEMKQGTDPNKPDLNLKYAIDKGLFPAYIELEKIKQMDADGRQDEKEKLTIDTAYEISQLNVGDTAKKDNITYLLSKPSEFLDVYKTLKAVSDDTLKDFLELGIDDNVVEYLSFVSSLTDKEFANYAIKNKLCTQDKNINTLEKNFLQEPEEYKQEWFNHNISEIEKIYPEFAIELKKIPDFIQIDIKDAEVSEDFISVAKKKSIGGISLDSMFSEGIKEKRKFCTPIQALVWSLYDDEEEYLDKKPWDDHRWPSQIRGHMKLVGYVWWRSTTSDNYQSNKWNFNEAVDRLNSPILIALYLGSNFNPTSAPSHFPPVEEISKKSESIYREEKGDCDEFA